MTVPVTWLPMPLAPTTRTSAVAVVTGARDGAAQHHGVARIVGRAEPDGDLRSTAAGPKWSVMYRPTRPLVVRMFMKMSGEPFSCASSASWCTSW